MTFCTKYASFPPHFPSLICIHPSRKLKIQKIMLPPPEKRKHIAEWALTVDWTHARGTCLSSEWMYAGMAGLPVSSEENIEGRRTLQNSASRTHRILNSDELQNGKQARWLELEVHGKVFLTLMSFESPLTCFV